MTINCNFHGRVGADGEVKTSKSGQTYAKIRIAAGDHENTQWISVAAFGDIVKDIAKLKKGDAVYVEGKLRLDRWRGKDDLIEHYGLSVVASKCGRIEMSKPSPTPQPSSPSPPSSSTVSGAPIINDDEIPF